MAHEPKGCILYCGYGFAAPWTMDHADIFADDWIEVSQPQRTET